MGVHKGSDAVVPHIDTHKDSNLHVMQNALAAGSLAKSQ